ncbi:MAG TPA: hypothetical protein P5205_16375 [Candidatus Paceibacterota bacterium]|nr:hypothetical protein [Verrucomicrobiota bacterium]HSA11938.1 hypothetical protein [Candidatus Paceibacterota bacterium]
MNEPPQREYRLSALIGAIVGSIGGLFAIGLVRAFLWHNLALLFSTPILGLLSFFLCGAIGWVLGGQIGPRLGEKLNSRSAEMVGGAVGGLIPVLSLALWAWYITTH